MPEIQTPAPLAGGIGAGTRYAGQQWFTRTSTETQAAVAAPNLRDGGFASNSQQAAEIAARHLCRRHLIRLPIARVFAAELLAIAEAGR